MRMQNVSQKTLNALVQHMSLYFHHATICPLEKLKLLAYVVISGFVDQVL